MRNFNANGDITDGKNHPGFYLYYALAYLPIYDAAKPHVRWIFLNCITLQPRWLFDTNTESIDINTMYIYYVGV